MLGGTGGGVSGVQDSNISATTFANMHRDTKYGTRFLENTIPGCKLWKADHSPVGLAWTTEHLDMRNIFLLFILPNSLTEWTPLLVFAREITVPFSAHWFLNPHMTANGKRMFPFYPVGAPKPHILSACDEDNWCISHNRMVIKIIWFSEAC